jgi:phage baseplate assembly protein W
VPLQEVSRAFRDISLTFKRHPVTNDITSLKNEDAIKRSVINLVRTKIGERFFNSLLGSRVEDYLFENADAFIVTPLQTEIRTVLNNFEPRVLTREVNVNLFPESNELDVTIVFDIVGLTAPTQNVNFILQPTRY